MGIPSSSELEQTLQRMVRRVAMMLQAEKCVFLLHDGASRELVARSPALGLTPEQIRCWRVPSSHGVSGTAFTTGQPVIVERGISLQPFDEVWFDQLEVRNLIAHPLIVEQRDEQERVIDRVTVGVLHVINKRGAERFSDEDLLLLSTMARQVTAAITSAQIYLKLAEEKEQLQATFESLLTGVVMVESTGRISLVNLAACHMFGLDNRDAIGRRHDEVITEPEISKMLSAAVEEGRETHAEIEILLPEVGSDPRIFQAQTAFVRGERDGLHAVLGVVAVFNDITEIRNVERMKTAFVSTVSHELRTPLTSIKGFVATLLQDTEGYFDQETRTEFYEIIDSECDRLRRLIEDLLNVSRIESGRALQMNWSNVDPVHVIEKVLQAQRSYTDKHKLKVLTHGDVPTILSDEDKFDQILTNLVSNAIKYSPSGGEVTVELTSTDSHLTVAVRDQGIGIPSDKLSRVFEKFERIDTADTRQAGGTGIGLFLVKHLVEHHQGKIWVESELKKGSSFIFEVPIHPEQADKDREQLGGGPAPHPLSAEPPH